MNEEVSGRADNGLQSPCQPADSTEIFARPDAVLSSPLPAALCRYGTQIGDRQEEEESVHAVLRRQARRVEGAFNALPLSLPPLTLTHRGTCSLCQRRLFRCRQAAGKKYTVPEQGKMLGDAWKALSEADKVKGGYVAKT